jgi:hypothetical protein
MLVLFFGLSLTWAASSFIVAFLVGLGYFVASPLIFLPLMQTIYRPARPEEASHLSLQESEMEWTKAAGLNDPPRMGPTMEDFSANLSVLLEEAGDKGEPSVDISAGELHRRAGFYPGKSHRMPECCRAMRQEMRAGDIILEEPPKGSGASLVVRYRLPRTTP